MQCWYIIKCKICDVEAKWKVKVASGNIVKYCVAVDMSINVFFLIEHIYICLGLAEARKVASNAILWISFLFPSTVPYFYRQHLLNFQLSSWTHLFLTNFLNKLFIMHKHQSKIHKPIYLFDLFVVQSVKPQFLLLLCFEKLELSIIIFWEWSIL